MTDLKTLQQLFDFTDDDLAANRAGKLSDRQREKFQQRMLRQQWELTANGLTLVMFVVTFFIYIAFSVTYGNQLGPLVLVALIVWLGLAYVLSRLIAKLPALMLRRYIYNPALSQPDLEHRTGRLKFHDDGEHRYVMLGSLELTTNVSANNDPRSWELQPDQNYTIYYTSNPLWIAAIEPRRIQIPQTFAFSVMAF